MPMPAYGLEAHLLALQCLAMVWPIGRLKSSMQMGEEASDGCKSITWFTTIALILSDFLRVGHGSVGTLGSFNNEIYSVCEFLRYLLDNHFFFSFLKFKICWCWLHFVEYKRCNVICRQHRWISYTTYIVKIQPGFKHFCPNYQFFFFFKLSHSHPNYGPPIYLNCLISFLYHYMFNS